MLYFEFFESSCPIVGYSHPKKVATKKADDAIFKNKIKEMRLYPDIPKSVLFPANKIVPDKDLVNAIALNLSFVVKSVWRDENELSTKRERKAASEQKSRDKKAEVNPKKSSKSKASTSNASKKPATKDSEATKDGAEADN